MYHVKITLKPHDPEWPEVKYKSTSIGGLFNPKGKRCTVERVKDQIQRKIVNPLFEKHPNLSFKVTITVKSAKCDFVLNEE